MFILGDAFFKVELPFKYTITVEQNRQALLLLLLALYCSNDCSHRYSDNVDNCWWLK